MDGFHDVGAFPPPIWQVVKPGHIAVGRDWERGGAPLYESEATESYVRATQNVYVHESEYNGERITVPVSDEPVPFLFDERLTSVNLLA